MKPLAAIFLVCILLRNTSPCVAQVSDAKSPNQLKHYIAELQKSPDDQALREKIIKLALTLNPKPEIPEAAERSNARGKAAVSSDNP